MLCSRFFTARSCNPQKAYALFKEAVEARKVNEMAEFYRSLELELYEETRLLVGTISYIPKSFTDRQI